VLSKFELKDIDQMNDIPRLHSVDVVKYANESREAFIYREPNFSCLNRRVTSYAIELPRGDEFYFALRHNYGKTLKCILKKRDIGDLDDVVIHEFIAPTFQATWIMEGLPLFCLKIPSTQIFLQFIDYESNVGIISDFELFSCHMNSKHRRIISESNVTCLGKEKSFVYENGKLIVGSARSASENSGITFSHRKSIHDNFLLR